MYDCNLIKSKAQKIQENLLISLEQPYPIEELSLIPSAAQVPRGPSGPANQAPSSPSEPANQAPIALAAKSAANVSHTPSPSQSAAAAGL